MPWTPVTLKYHRARFRQKSHSYSIDRTPIFFICSVFNSLKTFNSLNSISFNPDAINKSGSIHWRHFIHWILFHWILLQYIRCHWIYWKLKAFHLGVFKKHAIDRYVQLSSIESKLEDEWQNPILYYCCLINCS